MTRKLLVIASTMRLSTCSMVYAAAVCRRDQAGLREAWRDLDLVAGLRRARSEDALGFAIARVGQLLAHQRLELRRERASLSNWATPLKREAAS
jgi:uncharacterized membrane protein